MTIPTSYHDGNPEDRAYLRDFWSWLVQQPQQAWLYYARAANWDQADSLFIAMVRHPACDRALASWLFWSSDPAYAIRNGIRPGSDTLVGAILDRSETDGFPESRLHYRRVEVAFLALQAADALEGLDRPPPFRIPRPLCAGFDGGNPDMEALDQETERDLAQIFRNLDGKLPRSDAESLEGKDGKWWYRKALRLPSRPRPGAEMSDIEAIDAVFGEHRSSLSRIEAARLRSRAKVRAAAAHRRESAARPGPGVDPRQRAIGLGLLVASILSLLALLIARLVS